MDLPIFNFDQLRDDPSYKKQMAPALVQQLKETGFLLVEINEEDAQVKFPFGLTTQLFRLPLLLQTPPESFLKTMKPLKNGYMLSALKAWVLVILVENKPDKHLQSAFHQKDFHFHGLKLLVILKNILQLILISNNEVCFLSLFLDPFTSPASCLMKTIYADAGSVNREKRERIH